MKNILFVYNPVAGQARIQKNMYEVVDFYDSRDYSVTLCPIRKLESRYFELAKTTTFDRIICSGGDGTLNQLMTFLVSHRIEVSVGYLPAGSTNDYAHSLGISDDLDEAMYQTVYGTAHSYDVGMFNDRYFTYVAGFGMFTKVSYATPQKTKNMLGHTAYVLEGIKEISDLKKYDVKIDTGSFHLEGTFIIGLITNSIFVGGFKDILPADSALDDGEFEVLLFKEPKNIIDLRELIVAMTKGELKDNPNVLFIRCNHIEITSKTPMDWTLDGEYGGSLEVANIQNINRVFSIIS